MSNCESGSCLDRLKTKTVVVADTGDFESILTYKPTDATTNPSLILQAILNDKYSKLVDQAIADAKKAAWSSQEELVDRCIDFLSVFFGKEILKTVPGRVSTEVDARLSFNQEATVKKALELIDLYKFYGIEKERVLIKIASTWEGISAARILENQYGIHCNMTLIFSLAQAVACAEANVTLISPFVGRILDWYLKNTDKKSYTSDEDPGVRSVKEIHYFYRSHGYKTTVMGASFRNIGQIKELFGIDLLTIPPKLLEALKSDTGEMPLKLDPEPVKNNVELKLPIDEAEFRWMMNQDAMATDKLAEGIRNFHNDTEKVRKLILSKL